MVLEFENKKPFQIPFKAVKYDPKQLNNIAVDSELIIGQQNSYGMPFEIPGGGKLYISKRDVINLAKYFPELKIEIT